jgi:oligopeptide transport system substrate-binding protein
MPLPQSAYKDIKAFGENPVGNGSYMMDGKWVHNVSIKVKKNPGYKGTLVAKNAGVDVKVYTDQNSSYSRSARQQRRRHRSHPGQRPAQLQGRPGRSSDQPARWCLPVLLLPLYQPEWKGDKGRKVRQAISMAINRKQITDSVFQGTRVPATDFSSPVVQGHSTTICGDLCTFNPEKAKALLAEAGGFTGSSRSPTTQTVGTRRGSTRPATASRTPSPSTAPGKSYPDFKSLRDPITKAR